MKKIKTIKNLYIYSKQDGNDHYDVRFDAVITDEKGNDFDYILNFEFYDCIMNINMDTNIANIEFEPIVAEGQKFPFVMQIKL